MKRTRVIIMGAAGRDFHNFNCCFRNDPTVNVVAFTAAQIPWIDFRSYPPSLAGPRYPRGIPVRPEAELEELIRRHRVDQVIFAYSDVSHDELMHVASRVLACGADFRLIGPGATMLRSRRPVVSVCAVRTGCGKSQVVDYFCDILNERGVHPVVVRHPMPYGDLERQRVQRFAGLDDLDRQGCTFEEREEYEPLLARRATVFAGVDYAAVLRQAEKEAELIVWDGGNNDFPFFRPDLEIVLVDPLRPGHESAWYPGEANLRRADIVVVNKVNAASEQAVAGLEESVRRLNPRAILVRTASTVEVEDGGRIAGKRVLVVEDGPTITHGSMQAGAGLAAAGRYGAMEVVDPRPHAQGSLVDVYRRYPHIGPVLPAMGYRPEQIYDLARTVAAVPCDLILVASPLDLGRLVRPSKPLLRVACSLEEVGGTPLRDALTTLLDRYGVGPTVRPSPEK